MPGCPIARFKPQPQHQIPNQSRFEPEPDILPIVFESDCRVEPDNEKRWRQSKYLSGCLLLAFGSELLPDSLHQSSGFTALPDSPDCPVHPRCPIQSGVRFTLLPDCPVQNLGPIVRFTTVRFESGSYPAASVLQYYKGVLYILVCNIVEERPRVPAGIRLSMGSAP